MFSNNTKLKNRQQSLMPLMVLLAICGIVLITTQAFAYFWNYDPGLGRPVLGPLYGIGILGLIPQTFHEAATKNTILTAIVLMFVTSWAFSVFLHTDVDRDAVHGTARFATPHEVLTSEIGDRGVVNNLKHICKKIPYLKQGPKPPPLVIGKLNKTYLLYHGDKHAMLVAPTGEGKSVGIAVPQALIWPESIIITDIKGELWDKTSGFRSKFSHTMYFNPCDEKSIRINPLDYVRKGDFEVRDAQLIATELIDPNGEAKWDFWDLSARDLLVGLILHVVYSPNITEKTLEKMCLLLSAVDQDSIVVLFKNMMATKHLGNEPHKIVASIASAVMARAPEERSGVISAARNVLTLYQDPIIARNTGNTDIFPLDLVSGKAPVSLYIIIPPSDIKRLRPLIRLIFSLTIFHLTEKLDPHRRKLCVLADEIAAFKKMVVLSDTLPYLRGYGIQLFLIFQDLLQLKDIYGQNNSFLSNSNLQIYFAPNEIDTAKILSERIGSTTLRFRNTSLSAKAFSFMPDNTSTQDMHIKRPLMTPDEILRLPSTQELVFLKGLRPFLAEKIRYYDDPWFAPRLLESASQGRDGHLDLPPHCQARLKGGQKATSEPQTEQPKNHNPDGSAINQKPPVQKVVKSLRGSGKIPRSLNKNPQRSGAAATGTVAGIADQEQGEDGQKCHLR